MGASAVVEEVTDFFDIPTPLSLRFWILSSVATSEPLLCSSTIE